MNAKDFEFSIRLNFKRAESESNLDAMRRAIEKTLRDMGKSAEDAATQYFQTRFKDTDIQSELTRLEDTLNDLVDRLNACRKWFG